MRVLTSGSSRETSLPAGILDKFRGLNNVQVLDARKSHPPVHAKKANIIASLFKAVLSEPMILILLAIAGLYWFTGNTADAVFMIVSIAFLAIISIFQNIRTSRALKSLRNSLQPVCQVIREGRLIPVQAAELVPGDTIMVEQGNVIPADGVVVHANDLQVNESSLTGESLPVQKDSTAGHNTVYQGTTLTDGLALISVTATGNATRLARIGILIDTTLEEPGPLELQLKGIVKTMVFAGLAVFAAVWLTAYLRSKELVESLLQALTLGMSILPEEIVIAYSVFMAIGAWRLMKNGVLVKQLKTIETLGSASVICTDKTGTITENRMSLAALYTPQTGIRLTGKTCTGSERELLEVALLASEPVPFDTMEKSLYQAGRSTGAQTDLSEYRLIHEYPLSGKPPMMTHVYGHDRLGRVIAAKGAPEAIIRLCSLSGQEADKAKEAMARLTADGYRVLAVGRGSYTGKELPATQQEIGFGFMGLLAFYDPPKQNMPAVLNRFYGAGLKVYIITGDNAATTMTIAKQIGFRNADRSITGDEVMGLIDEELVKAVGQKYIYTRMFPEAKLRVIDALKASGEIVAMTGDGVNDGPALKAAHIGIAMGNRGTEIAKGAATMILANDDLAKMNEAIAMGRKIYFNLKRAILYIISIHLPIILTVLVPMVSGWRYPLILLPAHVIFLELLMGPVCSVALESEPAPDHLMKLPPRSSAAAFFTGAELWDSLYRGLLIGTGSLLIYRMGMLGGLAEAQIRTLIFTHLVMANFWLVLKIRLATTGPVRNPLLPVLLIAGLLLSLLILALPVMRGIFNLEMPAYGWMFSMLGVSWIVVNVRYVHSPE